MPGKKTHQYVGAGSGAIYAALLAKNELDRNFWIEVLGGGFGGYFGGIIPDILEPAVSSWHRDICHSWSAAGVIVYTRSMLIQWQEFCRIKAAQCAMPMLQDPHTGQWIPMPSSPIQKLIAQITEVFWRFLAGFLNGMAAGYVSHLALDAETPRGIPLLGARIP